MKSQYYYGNCFEFADSLKAHLGPLGLHRLHFENGWANVNSFPNKTFLNGSKERIEQLIQLGQLKELEIEEHKGKQR